MTIDEAIRHCEEVAERYDRVEDSHADDGLKQECIQCAADHRQLAEWLTDYEGLRAEIIDLRLYVQMLEEYRKEAKRLLKAAVEDMNGNNICFDINACNVCAEKNCISCDTFHWRYTDEALKLIES